MSLLREIQTAAADSKVFLPDLLRKCKILAVRLKHKPFQEWVDRELNGYPPEATVPAYRIIPATLRANFIGPFGSGVRNAVIPLSALPEKFRRNADKMAVRQPISELQALVRNCQRRDVMSHWAAEIAYSLSYKVFVEMACVALWATMSIAAIEGLLDNVRTRILNFALEIEAVAPQAGEASPGTEPLGQERVSQVFQHCIFENIPSVAAFDQRHQRVEEQRNTAT